MKRSSRWWLAIISAAWVLLTLGILYRPILIGAAHWLDVGETPRAADYVMVLPGGRERRPFVAIAMIRAGLVKGVLTAETETDPANDEGLAPATGDILRRILRLRGIPEEQIEVLPGQSNSTWTDAVALAIFLRQHPHTTVAIVTDDFHTRRSRWVFRRVLGSDATRVFFLSAPPDEITPENWWKSEEGLQIYLSEYFKFVCYVTMDRGNLISGATIFLVAIVLWLRLRRLRRRKSASECTASASEIGVGRAD